MQLTDLVAQAITVVSSYLAVVAARGIDAAQGVAARALAELVGERLRQDGHGSAWEVFARDQRDASLVQYLLQQALESDASFRARFDAAAQQAIAEAGRAVSRAVSATGPGGNQVGDNLAVGGDYVGGNVSTTNRTSVEKGINPIVALSGMCVVAVLAVVIIINVIGALLGGLKNINVKDGGLTADSTCQQFLSANEQTEEQAMVDIALAKGLRGFGSPLALPEVRYDCSSQPNGTVGDVIQKLAHAF
jgi:hypothetical protein